MPASGGGFEQAYNAQAGVDIDTHLIVEQHVADHTNDKLEIASALERLNTLPEALGHVEVLLADTGDHSRADVEQCEAAGIESLIPERRQRHNTPLTERFADDPVRQPDAVGRGG